MNRVDLKVVLLGNAMVGKTSLMERYVHDSFNGNRPYQNVSIHSIMCVCMGERSHCLMPLQSAIFL